MKKIKSRAKRISLVAAVCMLLCTFGALAEGSGFEVIDPPSVEAATGIATVSGLLNATETNVVLMVFMPGTQLEGILNTPAALTEKLYYTDTVKSASDREFLFQFDMTKGPDGVEGETGVYPYLLACGETATGTISYTNRNMVLAAIRAVAACETAEELQRVLTAELAEELGISTALAAEAQKLTGDLIAAAYGAVVDATFDADSLDSAAIIQGLFEEPAAFALLQSTVDAAQLQAYIGQYNDYYGFDMGANSNYAKITQSANRTIVYQVLAKEGDMTSKETAQASFAQAALIGYLNDITASGTMQEVLRANTAALGLDFTAYDALSNDTKRAGVINDLMNLTLTSTAEVAAQFNALVAQYAASSSGGGSITTTPPGAGGSGSGGSGGKNSGSTYVGIVSDGTSTGTEEDPTTENAIFNDLAGSEWAQESILALYNRGVVNGKGNGIFDPEGNVTRAEFVKMIVAAFQLTADTQGTVFEDVAQTDWYYDVVRIGAVCGIVNGYGSTFGPNDMITREDAAVILTRAAQYAGISLNDGTAAGFIDAGAISGYAVEAVGTMQANGIVSGMEDGSFQPQQNTTRAQASKMLYELLKK